MDLGTKDSAHMSAGNDVDDLLSLAERRRPYLSLLSAGPEHKRDVIDELGDSRSTVDRAIERLADRGLVDRTDDGAWTATTKGELLLETVEETRACVESIAAGADLLAHLPCDEPVPPALFRDAAVDIADGPTPLAIAERVRDTVATATGIRGFAVADHGAGVNEDILASTFGDDGFEFDYVFDRSLVEGMQPAEDVSWAELTDPPNAHATVASDLPFGLMLTEHDDGPRLTIVVYDDRNVVQGQVQTDNPEAVAWGSDVFERYRERGTPLTTWLESNGR